MRHGTGEFPALVIDRRTWVLVGLSAAVLGPRRLLASVARAPRIEVRRNPGCGCCEGWADHMRKAGFEIDLKDDPELAAYRTSLGIPAELVGCHTGVGEGYIFEGHIPASVALRFLKERPAAKGLAVAGMPAGSPGMESSTPVAYDVMAWDGTKVWVYEKITPPAPQ